MHLEFKLLLDKIDSSALPDLKDAEIDFLLNQGMLNYIKARYTRLNIYGQGFEEIQKRTDDLKALVVTKFAPVSVVTTEENTYKLDIRNLTNDEAGIDPYNGKYLYYLRGRSKNTETCGSSYEDLNIKRHDELKQVLRDPFNKPSFEEPIAYFENGDLLAVTDGNFTITASKITFLKWPFLIDKAQILNPLGLTGTDTIELDFPEEIIKYAVEATLELIESPRQQTFMQQMKLSE
jgi:hypothetical protein